MWLVNARLTCALKNATVDRSSQTTSLLFF